MAHTKAFKKYYIATISSINDSYTFILNHRDRGRIRRALTIMYNERIRYKINRDNMIPSK